MEQEHVDPDQSESSEENIDPSDSDEEHSSEEATWNPLVLAWEQEQLSPALERLDPDSPLGNAIQMVIQRANGIVCTVDQLQAVSSYLPSVRNLISKIGLFGKDLSEEFNLVESLAELYPNHKVEGGPCRAVVNDDRFVYRCLDCRKNDAALMCHDCYDSKSHHEHR